MKPGNRLKASTVPIPTGRAVKLALIDEETYKPRLEVFYFVQA